MKVKTAEKLVCARLEPRATDSLSSTLFIAERLWSGRPLVHTTLGYLIWHSNFPVLFRGLVSALGRGAQNEEVWLGRSWVFPIMQTSFASFAGVSGIDSTKRLSPRFHLIFYPCFPRSFAFLFPEVAAEVYMCLVSMKCKIFPLPTIKIIFF